MEDDPVELCPECGGEVRRLIQPVRVAFKGFYVTENKKAESSTVTGAGK
jgi:predicted nucleic acid-binding Zn ribbon protein